MSETIKLSDNKGKNGKALYYPLLPVKLFLTCLSESNRIKPIQNIAKIIQQPNPAKPELKIED
jgi:hypothetical protein